MKYACLVYLDETLRETVPDRECKAFGDGLRARGCLLGGEALRPSHTATVVRVRNGGVALTDGPFAETKEQLAGFYLIDAADLNEAIQIAARIPPARVGSIEVRPVRELDAG
ncbi:MAG: YciI family protein [Burkholderiales bacterium]|nr:YciI family protein [Burkholderiales bacterium]